MIRQCLIEMVFSLIVVAPAWAQVTGAQVPENLIQRMIYVNMRHPRADDSNPGTAPLPLKTVGAATQLAQENNKRNIGTKILIYPGVYRESIERQFTRQATDAPIVFEAQTTGQAIISGSDVWTGWTRQGTTNIYTHPWPYQWGTTPSPWKQITLQPIVGRREMIFANGQPLEQVLSLPELQAKEGTFYVDEVAGTVSVRLPAGSTPANTTLEVATRPILLKLSSATNIVLRGLIFQHANSAIGVPAVNLADSSNVLVDGCKFRWNNWTGLRFWQSRNVTVQRNVADHNGSTGMNPVKMKNVLFEDNETSYNNWRGAQGGFTGWATSGMKNLFIHDGVYRRHTSLGNQTNGLWFDTDCANIVIDEARLCDNLMEGLFLEANQGPITVKNSVICNNGKWFGVRILGSRHITLDSNTIYGNHGTQVGVDNVFDRPVIDWETGEHIKVKVEHLVLKDNVIVGKNRDQLLLNMPGWAHLLDSFTSTRNLWFHPEMQNPFSVDRNHLDLRAWQTTTNQDLNSRFTDPRFTNPAEGDFSPRSDSPLRRN